MTSEPDEVTVRLEGFCREAVEAGQAEGIEKMTNAEQAQDPERTVEIPVRVLLAELEELRQEVRQHERQEQRLAELVDQLVAEKAARYLTDVEASEALRLLQLWMSYTAERTKPRARPPLYKVTETFLACVKAKTSSNACQHDLGKPRPTVQLLGTTMQSGH